MLARFKHLFIKEFLELFRDPRMRALTFIFPAIQILILAQAFVLELKNVDIALIDHDRTSLSRELIAAFTGSGYFRISHENCSEKEAEMLLAAEKIRAIFIIPSDFSRKAFHPDGSEFSVITDGTGSNDSGLIQGYASRIFSSFLNEKRATDSTFFASIAWFNPNLESRFYYIPGLIGIQMVVISFLLASIAIVKEKEVGTIEQLMVTPIRVSEFILGKTLPYLAIGCIASTIMLLAAFGFYGISVKGSWFLLYLSICVFLAGNLGGALIISVISRTQQQALLTAFFFMLPLVMLSGLLFPIRNMPEPIQIITMVNPLRWFFQILHSVIVKGGGIREIAEPLAAQFLIAVSFIAIAITGFKKASE
ncbi:MAG: ABC transporter permease [Candidatus Riflebacteria bacterium]